MVIGILQPGYLPWLGFFEQMHNSDVFVIYDDVQYDKEGWRNRNRIKTANGIQWLTVPVLLKGSDSQMILDVRIDNKTNWRKKHLAAIRQSYSKAPCFKDYIDIFEDAYARDWDSLVALDMYFIQTLAECLGMGHKNIVRSSTLNIQGDRIERLIKICEFFGADVFYEGASGKNYIDERDFLARGVKVEFQNYLHPAYRQLYNDFTPNLSVIDLLFNRGKESLGIITANIKGEYHRE
jgi:hypothetical protein